MKIGPVDPDIINLQEVVKNIKIKKLTQAEYYVYTRASLPTSLLSGLKLEFHGTDTNTDTDTDIRDAPIV